jgi:hypothetical protein
MPLDPLQTGLYVPVELRFEVDRVLKGAYSREIAIVDATSLHVIPASPDGPMRHDWAGGAGACGALDHDPTGWYAVFGLHRTEGRQLRTNRLTTFYLREQRYDDALFEQLRARYGLPLVGVGTSTTPSMYTVLVIALAALGATSLAGGAVIREACRRYR